MKKLFYKVWNWYKGLPWWGKILGVLVLVLVLVLGVLYLISLFVPGGVRSDLKEIDELTGTHTEELLEHLEDNEKKLKKDIKKKKKELAKKVNQAEKIDAETLERRKKIEKASTMEELDKLQEDLDL